MRRAGEQVARIVHLWRDGVELWRSERLDGRVTIWFHDELGRQHLLWCSDTEPDARRANFYDSLPAKAMRTRLLETLRRRVGTDQEALRIIDALAGALDQPELHGLDTKLHPGGAAVRGRSSM